VLDQPNLDHRCFRGIASQWILLFFFLVAQNILAGENNTDHIGSIHISFFDDSSTYLSEIWSISTTCINSSCSYCNMLFWKI